VNWKKSADTWDDADFNLDGVVDAKDPGILASNWQVGATDGSSGSLAPIVTALGLPVDAVPEPGAGIMLLMIAPLVIHRWTRRHAGFRGAEIPKDK
jgi:hypothetical protein